MLSRRRFLQIAAASSGLAVTGTDLLSQAVANASSMIRPNGSRGIRHVVVLMKALSNNVVITMGCGDTCPVYHGKRYLDWDLPDPAGLTIDQIWPIRDAIADRARHLLTELTRPDPEA
jgi:arsenate reductase (thioredoxin)